MATNYIVPLSSVRLQDIGKVGGKNASLGEMYGNLEQLGVQIPSGFAITIDGYFDFLRFNGLQTTIQHIIDQIDHEDLDSLRRAGSQIRLLVNNGRFPKALSDHIITAYESLSGEFGEQFTDVAVRSSATAEDLPDASFAGQQETFLNVRGPALLMDAVRNCFASLFTDRAISYRNRFNYDQCAVGLSICIQKMVRSDLGAAGVSFSLDTESGFADTILISGAYGLGELIVQGAIAPDEFLVSKQALDRGFYPIVEKKLGQKDKMMVYSERSDERVKIIPIDKLSQHKFCLTDEQVIELAAWVRKIEQYYSSLHKRWTPVDVEWALDGTNNQLYIVQARPETVHSNKKEKTVTTYKRLTKEEELVCLLKGIAVGNNQGAGKVNIFYSMNKHGLDVHEFNEGDVLVTDMTDPDWEPIMKKAAAIITNKGGRTCHAAIVARELGVPAVVGCKIATDLLSQGQEVTVSCCEGETGIVYEGTVDFLEESYSFESIEGLKTQLLLNIASPETCLSYAQLPSMGVGLARQEFIVNNYVKIHPLALLNETVVTDAGTRKQMEELTQGFQSGSDYFVQKLRFGIGKIACAFYPRPVILRFSDFKSNEYANLVGGANFEPKEENPMMGWRGASRYYSSEFRAAFGLECEAIRFVREEMGFTNIKVMVPFCRTPQELQKVLEIMKEHGLERGEKELEIYVMAELPSNIWLAEDFAALIDGFSIGSNDLTQLTLGLDRDSGLVAHLYDERNPAVKASIRHLINIAKSKGVKVGICGQGPSDFADFSAFLVDLGIDSISVTPDALFRTTQTVRQIEAKQSNSLLLHA
ncbi:phosphoenolpyruvate synthase [Flavihumibacter sp. CACIAM 22H1]|uniref:phosphoenolpyruvate synthase n=1 Tax=Flavihumibacter sp. CACIAM 22H1 TaxID=1812911 RepID=UPI0007A7E8D0|nr:phosphoenolpyruvate synthase [Flavihumibacter sp. CACIAM 22H1]KYP16606.1 MAG: phosphoenolpyruvate synthase [Flavihumibacter sp. CACIAM 22H1]